MCGISGIVDLERRPVSRDAFVDVNDCLSHRGPDQGGVWVEGPMALGNRRLRILDLSPAGDQPMRSADGKVVLVFNGEIYNYQELRKQYLSNVAFRGHSDTEVLLQMYLKFGPKCLAYLNGEFGLAIWDARTGSLFCARDRLGIKPFFWARSGGRFVFGSEIKALLRAGVPARPDLQTIRDYLTFGYYDHSAHTFFQGIESLMPGHSLTLTPVDGCIKVERYWNLAEQSSALHHESDEDFYQGYKDLLYDAIRLRLRSDVPVGVNVSGGMDSCLVGVAMKDVTKGQQSFPMYCYGYDEPEYDEFPYAKRLADQLGWPITKLTLRPADVPRIIDRIVYHEEQAFPGIPDIAKHHAFQQLQGSDVKVVLSGHGGDETSGGYKYFAGAFMLDFVQRYGWKRANDELNAFLKHEGKEGADKGAFLLQTLSAMLNGGATSDAQSFAFANGLDPEFVKISPRPLDFEKPFSEFSLNMQYQDLRYTKVPRILRNADRASMSVGIEKRVPILDHRLVEYSFSAPLHLRFHDGHQRYFMREVARRILPSELMLLPKRHSSDPQRKWFQGELAPWIEEIFHSRSFSERGLFNAKAVQKEFEEYKQRKDPPTSYHLWQFVCLELWWRRFIDGVATPTSPSGVQLVTTPGS